MISSPPPVVLITGTSSGIGLHAALQAAQAGYRVIATLRNEHRAGALVAAAKQQGLELRPWILDVTDPAAIASVIGRVKADYGRLDVLINNAGVAHVGTLESLTDDDFRRAMDVNFFAVMNLTRAAMPLLRACAGRVITISSVGGVIGQPFNDAYCAAKFAVEGAMESFAPVAAAVGVDVVLVEPAAVASEFISNAPPISDNLTTADDPYAALRAGYLKRTEAVFATAQDPREVADVLVRLAGEHNPPVRVQTSPGAARFVQAKLADLDGSAVQAITRGWI